MENCLLCLTNPKESNQYIPVQSSQWIEWKVLHIIEKHFWPMVNSESIYGICQSCWSHLYEFHLFYCMVEKAHLKNVLINKQQTFYNSGKETNAVDIDLETLRSNTPHIFKEESISNEPLIFINDEIITDSKIEENFKKELIHYNVELMGTIKETVSKKKRGRPRKTHVLNKPKGKIGRPRKIFKEISSLSSTSVSNDIYAIDQLTGTNKKPKGKVGRPRKYFKDINDFPSTSRSLIQNGKSANKIYAIGSISSINKKPKGKVGRPRKYFKDMMDFSSTNKSSIQTSMNVKKMYAMCPPENFNCQYIKPKKRGRPLKNKCIQQHKVQENKFINNNFSGKREDLAMEETLIPEAALNTDCSEVLLNYAPLYDNDLQKSEELDFKNILKNKRMQ